MDDFSDINDSNIPAVPATLRNNAKSNGRVRTRHKKVASLLAMGYPIPVVAEETGMSQSRIYHRLSEKNSFLNDEINQMLDETIRTHNLFLANLYFEALRHLDLMLESPDPKERYEAIDQIIDLVFAKRTRNGHPMIAQYFNFQSQGRERGLPQSIDDLILQKHRERELPQKDLD